MENRMPDIVVVVYILLLLVIGLSLQPLDELVIGLYNIFTSTGVLVSDYMVIGGVGPALVNGSLVGLIGYIILKANSMEMTGLSIPAVFILIGFGLFGKNVWSILPIIFGVYLYSKIIHKEFKGFVYHALFATCLAPIVTHATFDTNLGLIGGILLGLLAGFMIAPIAMHVFKAHQGFNLYNVGFAAGFVGIFIYGLLRGHGFATTSLSIWGTGFDGLVKAIITTMAISMVVLGFIINKGSLKGFKEIFIHEDLVVKDHISVVGFGNTLINMGLIGFMPIIYIELVGGNFNGPTMGGILTIMGFGAMGKNPLSIGPPMLGIYLATIFSTHVASDPGPMLAALFVTGLAPITSRFGPIIGVLAGYIHLFIVSYVGDLHGGMNLYNNGFAAGFVCVIFLGIYQGFRGEG